MGQRSKVEPSTPMSPATALHPVLSSALANLDIQLEDELARYRRQRTGTAHGTRQTGRTQPANQLDLIAVSATSDRRIASSAAQPTPALEERLAGVASSLPIAHDAYKPIPAFTASPQPFEAPITLRKPEQPSHDGSAENVLLVSEGNNDHALAQAANPNLDDYLESSEELLRSLADEQAEVRAERSVMRSLLTPLGLGSMLLLLLSSAMFGYVVMNPSSLSWFTVKPPGDAPGQNPGQPVMAPPRPDLANRELPVLDPNNLGAIDPGKPSLPSSAQLATPTGKPTAATKAPAVGPPSKNEAAAPTQAPIPAVTSSTRRSYPTRVATPSQPASNPRPVAPLAPSAARTVPATSAPATASNRSGAPDGYQYKVGIPFENDQTLENARKVVPDAFVRTLPDGRTIVQVGAARSEAEVKVNMQGLRDQGLSSAEVSKR